MSNGIVKEIKLLIGEDGNSNHNNIPAKTRDRLLLASIAEIYTQLEEIKELLPWVRVWKWFILVIGPASILGILGFIISLISHKISIVIP